MKDGDFVRRAADINSRIAARVSELRAAEGLSLDALAERCGVSRSMLSLIERGESSPTAVVLERIATGLNVTLASLFDHPQGAANPLSRASDRTTWKDPQTGYLRRNISPPDFPTPIQIVEVTLPARARVAYDTATREVVIHQQLWMQEGTIDFTLGKHTYRLSEDDCLAMKLDAPTAFHNPTRKRARYVVVLTNESMRGKKALV
jgi:transcriptional regulator with XRE-family HTH domain